jgi:hypothetical protein
VAHPWYFKLPVVGNAMVQAKLKCFNSFIADSILHMVLTLYIFSCIEKYIINNVTISSNKV